MKYRTAKPVVSLPDGPSLETYIETRFNLLTKQIEDASASQASALGSSIEAMKQSLAAADLRYQQRFDAQADALAAAFSAAKEAVGAALAGADRAVLKAELAADKRFEALNELRQMLNDTLKVLMTRTETNQMVGAVIEKVDLLGKRVDALDSRVTLSTGEDAGHRQTRDDTKAYIAVAISILGLAAMVIFNLLRR